MFYLALLRGNHIRQQVEVYIFIPNDQTAVCTVMFLQKKKKKKKKSTFTETFLHHVSDEKLFKYLTW